MLCKKINRSRYDSVNLEVIFLSFYHLLTGSILFSVEVIPTQYRLLAVTTMLFVFLTLPTTEANWFSAAVLLVRQAFDLHANHTLQVPIVVAVFKGTVRVEDEDLFNLEALKRENGFK